jgi:hypothetical protein
MKITNILFLQLFASFIPITVHASPLMLNIRQDDSGPGDGQSYCSGTPTSPQTGNPCNNGDTPCCTDPYHKAICQDGTWEIDSCGDENCIVANEQLVGAVCQG